MRRKNWQKIIKKTYLFDNFARYNYLDFESKKYLRFTRLFKKSIIYNYNIYKFFLLNIKKLNKRYVYKYYINTQFITIIVNPAFVFNKQFFIKRNLFIDLLKENNVKYFNIKIINNNLSGYNYYFFNKNSLDLIDVLKNEKYKEIILYKSSIINKNYFLIDDFNKHINLNISILNLTEYYKIIILLFLFF